MWYSSVGRLGGSRAGLLAGAAPVAAAVTGVLLGGPAPRPQVWAGIAVVGVGLGSLEVRYATGDEEYLTFAREVEHPAVGEVIFADGAGQAHARRWTNRQSGRSAVRDSTAAVLVVAEALHEEAPRDVAELIAVLAAELEAVWSAAPSAAVLTAADPRFTFGSA
jgi:hypothetical protein